MQLVKSNNRFDYHILMHGDEYSYYNSDRKSKKHYTCIFLIHINKHSIIVTRKGAKLQVKVVFLNTSSNYACQ